MVQVQHEKNQAVPQRASEPLQGRRPGITDGHGNIRVMKFDEHLKQKMYVENCWNTITML